MFPFNFREKLELVLQISDIPLIIFFDSQITSIFAQKKVSLQFSPKYRDVLCAANLCYSLTYFGDSAITLIFAKGWGSLAFSKMMVKKVAKIGWKMNSVSYLVARADMLQVSSRIWEPLFFHPKKCLLVLTLRILIVMRLKEVHNLLWE